MNKCNWVLVLAAVLAACDGGEEAPSGEAVGTGGSSASGGAAGGGNAGASAGGTGGVAGSAGTAGIGGAAGGGGAASGATVGLMVGQKILNVSRLYALKENDQVVELNGPLTANAFGVRRFFVSPDGKSVLYASDEGAQQVRQLHIVSIEGGTPSTVSQVTPGGGVGWAYAWSPDGKRVAYQGELTGGGGTGLYVVGADGSNHVEIDARAQQLPDTGSAFKWSPDGKHLAYRADRDQDDTGELWVADSNGQNAAMLDADFPFANSARTFRWTGDGSRVVYLDGDQLVSALADGSGKVTLSNAAGDVYEFQPAPSGNVVVWTDDSGGPRELYSAAADGSSLQKIGSVAANGGAVDIEFAPNGSRLAYRSRTGGSGSPYALRTVAADGTGDTLVSAMLNVISGSTSRGYTWAPDSSRLAFFDSTNTSVHPIYTTLPDGTGTPIKISGDMSLAGVNFNYGDVNGMQQLASPAFSPDGSCVAYISDEENAGTNELFLVKPDGSGPCDTASARVLGGHMVLENGKGKVMLPAGASVRDQSYSALGTAGIFLMVLARGGSIGSNDETGLFRVNQGLGTQVATFFDGFLR